MAKLYFRGGDDEFCYSLGYFRWLLGFEGLDEITLHEAQNQEVEGFFWCREFEAPIGKGEGSCGKSCGYYAPRNGKSGCCKNYSLKFYEPSDKILVLHKEKELKTT